MANVRSANTFYIDTQRTSDSDDLLVKGLAVSTIVVTATAANGRLVLKDPVATPITKLDLQVPTSGESVLFDFNLVPVLFPNGLSATTLTNAVATVVFTENNR